ncbi:hypothetical protein [Sphingomonas montanisoli]|uniref:DUF3761 domain-containing protein n=1 Tax=Sphingomonas montanisoli TaxID=2606412 RepID=A0A5D9C7S0_9SPHN|nr:hypothetical protein [Sphingomonas montanisoli]TZG27814.1 hypothetical protein FYJ91_09665 [Sphingomonas montanisoli]
MIIRAIFSAALIAVSAPALAGGIGETHEVVSTPPGKLQATAYRPIDQKHCNVAPKSHPAGGRTVHHGEAYSADTCAEHDAAREDTKKRG